MISVRHLDVHFGQVRAVSDVSFDVAAGDTFGLVGESGCGKSTLLRVLSGLNRHWTGAIEVAGRAVGPARDKAFHRRVQMVFQDPFGSLHPRHTVDRALAEPIAIHGLDDAEGRIARALDDVGLGSRFRFRYPHQLSGGQRQRVAIARALILEPGILLLDEPTSALDVSIQAEVLNLLARLRAARDLTLILVSHNLAVVAHLCNRLAVMQAGTIVEEMTIDTLRHGKPAHPYSRELLDASLGYHRS
ncbi:ABC transporter ATP-binding protein [Vineibacter terrae]|uniref:Glutathione import ATP-binding protein GsiA n=1 Tax=Vineibacter terrae TaxID=2586908 RepID=A0A5C8PSS5_9HYPH|nr:ABC transporter ATP-binding protein [Vineibacter terrae]TXL78841.1 ABC transporter ATP-binding protein [Vineibacter terrae]